MLSSRGWSRDERRTAAVSRSCRESRLQSFDLATFTHGLRHQVVALVEWWTWTKCQATRKSKRSRTREMLEWLSGRVATFFPVTIVFVLLTVIDSGVRHQMEFVRLTRRDPFMIQMSQIHLQLGEPATKPRQEGKRVPPDPRTTHSRAPQSTNKGGELDKDTYLASTWWEALRSYWRRPASPPISPAS